MSDFENKTSMFFALEQVAGVRSEIGNRTYLKSWAFIFSSTIRIIRESQVICNAEQRDSEASFHRGYRRQG